MTGPYSALLQKINPSTTIITPNRRLAATLHRLYQLSQQSNQSVSWETPAILPLGAFIERTFTEYAMDSFSDIPFLLNPTQELFLWEKILSHTKESEQLLQLSDTAKLIKSAWGLLKQWDISLSHPAFHQTEDGMTLLNWINEYQTFIKKKCWLDSANLPNYLIEKINANEIKLPSHLILVGFTDLSPQWQALFSACKHNGCSVDSFSSETNDASVHQIKLPDAENEILAMALWAKSTLKNNAQATIGCVIPDLDKKRDRVMQIFSEVFAEEKTDDVNQINAFFNISAGKPLSRYSIIHAALQCLALNKKKLSIETLGYLLHTPFIGEAEKERIKRAHYDAKLRRKNINTLALSFLISTEETSDLALHLQCPFLSQRLKNFYALLDQQNKKLSYREWAILFNQLLSILGWPGERSLNSPEYQTVEHWLDLLNHFQSLDQIAPPVEYHQALKILFQIGNETSFQPKTPEAPIQVLGMLEAAGLPFDAVWIMGMNDIAWPPQPKPHPLIPKRLQREFNMPHATAERELIYCQQLINTFIKHAKKVIFSYAEMNEDLKLQASPLIRHFPLGTLDGNDFKKPVERSFLTQHLEFIVDEKGPDFATDERIRGGVNVLKLQALCPFKAFAEWRLHAHELESPQPGLRAKERGTLIHQLLETLWNQLHDQARLKQLDDDALHHLIKISIDDAIHTLAYRHSPDSRYMQLEKERLQSLIYDWLQYEKNRPPFRVMMNEKATTINMGPFDFSIRIDRIDELSNGTKLIIDYKTGKYNDIHHWFGERLEEPQLPLYAMLDPNNTAGICFAQIAAAEYGFKGVSDASLDIKGIKPITEIKKAETLSWNEQLNAWQAILSQLSHDFHQGIAKVDPKNPPQTCEYCALKPLCRMDEEVICHE